MAVTPEISSIESLFATGLAHVWDTEIVTGPLARDGTPVAGYRFTPKSAEDVAMLLHWAQESGHRLACTPQEALCLPQPIWLDVTALKRVRHYAPDDFVIQVETGLTVGELASILAKNGQMLPLSYPPETPLLEILAEEQTALETGCRGFLRDYVLKTEIATPNGQLTISGADVVKNVTGYDLHKLYVGSRNAFGVMTAVTLKLMAVPSERQFWLYSASDSCAIFAVSQALSESRLPLSLCEIFQDKEFQDKECQDKQCQNQQDQDQQDEEEQQSPQTAQDASEKASSWHLLVAIDGDATLLAACEAALCALPGVPHDNSQMCLDIATASAYVSRLQARPAEETLVEVALPWGQCLAFYEAVRQEKSLAGWSCQMRPAAGLMYLRNPDNAMLGKTLRLLQQMVQRHDGFLQVLKTPLSGIVNDPGSPHALFSLLDELNVPKQSDNQSGPQTVRHLLKALKHRYDPKGCLFTPYMPL